VKYGGSFGAGAAAAGAAGAAAGASAFAGSAAPGGGILASSPKTTFDSNNMPNTETTAIK
jgi:hypothetical protein